MCYFHFFVMVNYYNNIYNIYNNFITMICALYQTIIKNYGFSLKTEFIPIDGDGMNKNYTTKLLLLTFHCMTINH